MKKVLAVILFLGLISALSGCYVAEKLKEREAVMDEAELIMKCFDENDAETLKEVFCNKTVDAYSLDKELQNILDLYGSKSISHKIVYAGMEGGIKNGVWYDKHFDQLIQVKTDTGNSYTITYKKYLILIKSHCLLEWCGFV